MLKMSDENNCAEICVTKVKPKAIVLKIISILRILSILLIIAFGVIIYVSTIPRGIDDHGVDSVYPAPFNAAHEDPYTKKYFFNVYVTNCFGEDLDHVDYESQNKDSVILSHMSAVADIVIDIDEGKSYGFSPYFFITSRTISFCGIIFFTIWTVFISVILSEIKHNKIYLKETQIDGQVGVFSKKYRCLPFDDIRSVYVKSTLKDIMTGGKTVVVRGISAAIKISCVQNAYEFVNLAQAELQKWNAVKKATPNNEEKSSDAFDDMQKLKNLLDQGLISQEEYDKKREDLISRI